MATGWARHGPRHLWLHQVSALVCPFVINSRAGIEQAFRDYHTGKSGPIPLLARIRDR
jgi:hypothetical protein